MIRKDVFSPFTAQVFFYLISYDNNTWFEFVESAIVSDFGRLDSIYLTGQCVY